MRRCAALLLTAAVAAAGLAVPAGASAQEPRQPPPPPPAPVSTFGGGVPNPVLDLLRSGDELHLTAEQRARIDRIGKALDARNAPAWKEITAELARMRAQRASDDDTAATRTRTYVRPDFTRVRPLMTQVRVNSAAAMDSVVALLDPAQRKILQERVH